MKIFIMEIFYHANYIKSIIGSLPVEINFFAYRINISWTVFVITTAVALLIALLTISFQAIRAAVANPVKSLRTE